MTVRDLEIDLASRVVTLAGEAVQLSAKEYELLVALAEDPDPDVSSGQKAKNGREGAAIPVFKPFWVTPTTEVMNTGSSIVKIRGSDCTQKETASPACQ